MPDSCRQGVQVGVRAQRLDQWLCANASKGVKVAAAFFDFECRVCFFFLFACSFFYERHKLPCALSVRWVAAAFFDAGYVYMFVCRVCSALIYMSATVNGGVPLRG